MQSNLSQGSNIRIDLNVQSVDYCGDWLAMASLREIALIIFLCFSPWATATRNQTTANRNQEKKKEAAKLRMVQCQGAPIIDVKKSFKYLE